MGLLPEFWIVLAPATLIKTHSASHSFLSCEEMGSFKLDYYRSKKFRTASLLVLLHLKNFYFCRGKVKLQVSPSRERVSMTTHLYSFP